jgi:ABC-type multidrug transport system fused ATPase/permease subunit
VSGRWALALRRFKDEIELFSGTVKQNIARMAEDIVPEQVITAAKISGAHEMILRLRFFNHFLVVALNRTFSLS